MKPGFYDWDGKRIDTLGQLHAEFEAHRPVRLHQHLAQGELYTRFRRTKDRKRVHNEAARVLFDLAPGTLLVAQTHIGHEEGDPAYRSGATDRPVIFVKFKELKTEPDLVQAI